MSDTTVCSLCAVEKSRSDFYSRGSGKRVARCKACVAEIYRKTKAGEHQPRKYSGVSKRYPGEYETWSGMIKRCYTQAHRAYANYGGRGIAVCDRWRESFENFHADMGDRPAGLSIDRIDNNGNYEPSNCRWATCKQQSRNTRKARLITLNGETRCLTEWAELTGIKAITLLFRLDRGWSIEKAFTTPTQQRSGRRTVPKVLPFVRTTIAVSANF